MIDIFQNQNENDLGYRPVFQCHARFCGDLSRLRAIGRNLRLERLPLLTRNPQELKPPETQSIFVLVARGSSMLHKKMHMEHTHTNNGDRCYNKAIPPYLPTGGKHTQLTQHVVKFDPPRIRPIYSRF